MLDRKFITSNVDLIKTNCVNREVQVDVDGLVVLDNQRRSSEQIVQQLNTQANANNKNIRQAQDDAHRQAIIEEGRKLREEKETEQKTCDQLDTEILDIQRQIPNLSHPDAPIGKDDKANLELRKGRCEPRVFDFAPRDHVELGEHLGLFDFEGGARTTGHGFYFLKNDAVLLELALQRYVLNLLIDEGFEITVTPDLARNEILEGIGFMPRGPETQIYSVENSDLSLIATAEITLGGRMSGHVHEAERLPLKICGISHCYRTEAGAHGRANTWLVSSSSVHQGRNVRLYLAGPERRNARVFLWAGVSNFRRFRNSVPSG